jgi:hypothetical protein
MPWRPVPKAIPRKRGRPGRPGTQYKPRGTFAAWAGPSGGRRGYGALAGACVARLVLRGLGPDVGLGRSDVTGPGTVGCDTGVSVHKRFSERRPILN